MVDSINTYELVIVHFFPRNAMAIIYAEGLSTIFDQTTAFVRIRRLNSFLFLLAV